MNERILELARQIDWSTDTTNGELTKFAELIVGECINTIKLSAASHLKQNATGEEIEAIKLKVESALAAMTAVAEHFGVE